MGKPNFFIVGAAKAGTTALYGMLSKHPEVYLCPIKEPHHFATEINPNSLRPLLHKRYALTDIQQYAKKGMPYPLHSYLVQNRDVYESLFRFSGPAKAIGEASPSYLHSPTAATAIYQYNPDARIIIILRDPVSRLHSHYLMERRMGMTNLKIEAALKEDGQLPERTWGSAALYTELGFYAKQVKHYLQVFPANQILILWHEELQKKPDEVFAQVCDFLGINFIKPTSARYNVAEVPRFVLTRFVWRMEGLKDYLRKSIKSRGIRRMIRKLLFRKTGPAEHMPAELEQRLRTLYSSDIAELSEITGRNLAHWRGQITADSVS
jgi:hypothetical protein